MPDSNPLSLLERQLRREIRLQLCRAILGVDADDAHKLQELQLKLLKGEVRSRVEHFQPYGYASRPFAGAEAVFASLMGSREQGVALCVSDRRWRPQDLEPGEAALHTHEGTFLKLKLGYELEITVDKLSINAGGSTLVMDASGLTITTPSFDIEES